MECEDIGDEDGKEKADSVPDKWLDDNETATLKEIVSIRSEESVTDAASKQIEERLNQLNTGAPNQTVDGNQRNAELDRRVRIGEITPFQAADAAISASGLSKDSNPGGTGLSGLEQYLKRQAEFSAQRKIFMSTAKGARASNITLNKSKKGKSQSNPEKSGQILSKKRKVSCTGVKENSTEITIEKEQEDTSALRKQMQDGETKNHDSGSEYLPSDGEIMECEAESEVTKTVNRQKKRRRRDTESENSVPEGNRILDDGDDEMYKQRMDTILKDETAKDSLTTVDNLFKVPKSVWKRLYEYQRVSVRWLWELHGRSLGGLLGDEMGLGKTVQVIAFLAGLDVSELLTDGGRFRGLGPTLIICPATLLEQWVRHFRDWAPSMRVVVLHHSGTYRGDPGFLVDSVVKTGGILITSYSGVLGHEERLVQSQWHYVILDEGHKIRNPDAKISKAIKKFSTPHRLLLTGSPMQNSLKELWSLFDFILPGKLGTLPAFLEHCANPITRGGYANASPLQEATALQVATMLKDAIAPYMLRRTKNDVQHHLSLPEKNEQVLFCCLTEEQKNLYKEYLRTDHVSSVLHDRGSRSENGAYRARLLVALTTLRKICNHPDLYIYGNADGDSDDDADVVDKSLEKFGHWRRSGKTAVVRSLLKIWKRQGHRVLLFTQGRQMMHVLEALIQREGYSYLRLDGSTPMTQRQQTIRKFNSDPSFFVFISTTRVGGLGVNLTGANRVVIYDPDWNPAIDAQARERAWRIGQDKRVTIYRLITAGTIEEKIYHRQIFKLLLSNRVLEDPRQRRLFQTSDLAELFNLNEPIDGRSSESDRIFSDCKLKPVEPRLSQRKVEAMRKLASSVSKKIEEMSKKNSVKSEDNKKDENNEIKEDEETEKCSSLSNEQSNESKEENNESKDEEKESNEEKYESKEEKNDSKEETVNEDKEPLESREQAMEVDPVLEDNRKKKRRRKSHKRFTGDEVSALFEGERVSCLIGRRLGRSSPVNEHVSSTCDDQYVLKKLFAKTNVSSAFQHDAVLSNATMNEGQVNPMHRMARDTAEENMGFVRESRKWCWKPTWDSTKTDD